MNKYFLFSGSSNKPLAKLVTQKLKTKLGKIELKRFADGECRVRIEENVEGKPVYLLQSLSDPVDEHFFEFALMVNSAKRLNASKVIGIIPWLGYSKQDKAFRKGESVSTEVIAKMLTAIGLSKLIVFDLHSQDIRKYYKIPLLELSAKDVLAKSLNKYQNPIVICPDEGGKKRVTSFAKKYNFPIAYLKKKRNLKTGIVTYQDYAKDLKQKTVIIFDDIINTGGTIVKSSNLLASSGAKNIIILTTHGVLAKDAAQKLQDSSASKIILTDTINIPSKKKLPKISIVSIADIIANYIDK